MAYAPAKWVEPFAADRRRRRTVRLDFARRYGVKRMSETDANVLKVLDTASIGGPPMDWDMGPYRRDLFNEAMIGRREADRRAPLNRLEVWGRNGAPLFLVGHPTASMEVVRWSPAGFPILGVAGATFAASVTGAGLGSWWGPVGWSGLHGHLVVIGHGPAVLEVCGPDAKEPAGVCGTPAPGSVHNACRLCGCAIPSEPEYVGWRIDEDSGFAPACSICAADPNADWRLWSMIRARLRPTG